MSAFLALTWQYEGDQFDAGSGQSVASAGDVNADGHLDVLVGSPDRTFIEGQAGTAELFLGSSTGLGARPDMTTSSRQEIALFGWSVAGAGDVDADGFDDFLVGSLLYDGAVEDAGGAWLYLGGPSVPPYGAAWQIEGAFLWERLGSQVAGAGDLNGDGFADALISSDLGSPAPVGVFYGEVGGLSSTSSWAPDPTEPSAAYETVGAAAGDVDGDGLGDALMGVQEGVDGSNVFLYPGSPGGLETSPDWTSDLPGGWEGLFGSAGDVDADGYADVVAGGVSGVDDVPTAWLWLGGAPGLGQFAWTFQSDEFDLAPVTGTAGDLDGDGFGDVALASWGTGGFGGRVDVFLGEPGGLGSDPAWFADGDPLHGTEFGFAVAGAGDLDGDGYGELLVGAPVYTNGDAAEGAVFEYAGACFDSADADMDAIGDACDVCPGFDDSDDADGDGVPTGCDGCPDRADPEQLDRDHDGLDDPCDLDRDGDGALDDVDSAPDDPLICGDSDVDGCDDCAGGRYDPTADGPDADGDGICDVGDPTPCGPTCEACDGECAAPPEARAEGGGCGCRTSPASGGAEGLLALAACLVRNRRPPRGQTRPVSGPVPRGDLGVRAGRER